MKTETIQIIDRGRGPQLSTSRVTIQDLVPYFQEGCTYDEIIRWIPTLSAGERSPSGGFGPVCRRT